MFVALFFRPRRPQFFVEGRGGVVGKEKIALQSDRALVRCVSREPNEPTPIDPRHRSFSAAACPGECHSQQKGPIVAESVDAPIRRNDPRPQDFQAQIEDLRTALQNWRRTREYSQPTEERLAQITVQCARTVETWQQMEQRRSAVVTVGDNGGGDRRAGEDRRSRRHRRAPPLPRTRHRAGVGDLSAGTRRTRQGGAGAGREPDAPRLRER